jgi:phage terminase large subunit
MWVEDVYYWDSKVKQRQKTDTEYAEDLKIFIKDKPIKAIYIDPSAASFKLELGREGVSNLFDAENEVLDGIRLVSKFLSNGTLKICRKCESLIKEIQGYVWDPKCGKTGEDKPLKDRDHACDSLRYALYTHFFGKEQSRMTAQDLDRLYIEAMGGSTLPAPFRDIPGTDNRFV